MNPDYKYYIMMVVSTFFWGGSWVSAKILVDLAPPLTIGFFRFLSALFFFLVLISTRSDWRPARSELRGRLRYYFLMGLTGVFGYGVFFLVGMRFTTAAQGAIIAGFNPVTISIVAHFIHKESLSNRWQYIGFAISFMGIIFVIGIQAILDFQLEYLIGNLIIVMAMITWGFYASAGKESMKHMSSVEATAGGVFLGMVMFGVSSAIFEQFWMLPAMTDGAFWFHVLFLGIAVTFIGFMFFFEGVNNLSATRTAIFINLVPVFGTLLSVLILNEAIYPTFIIGLLLVVTGVCIINIPSMKNPEE
jgi:drug/metabolite transporter (DMT)-like permease